MSLISNTGTLTITGSALAGAAAALSAGSWGTWTIGNSLNTDFTNVSGTNTEYVQTALWDPVNKVIQFFGGVHGNNTGSEHATLCTYNDSTNLWSTPIPVSGGNLQFEHTYYNFALDTVTGAYACHHAFSSRSTIRPFDQATRTFGTTFQSPSGISNDDSNPMSWHPTLGLIWGSWQGIYRRSGSSWVNLAGSGFLGSANAVSAYNTKDNCCYFGGGTESNTGKFTRINASGTVTACQFPPSNTLSTFDVGSSSSFAMLLGGTSTAKMILVSKAGDIREYDESANSWGSVVTTVPSAVWNSGINPAADWFGCVIPEYNCFVFFKLASAHQLSTTGHIWKR